MTMDQKSKNIDCYFYFYSECVRGNFCKFRHEPLALGCEDMCLKWKEGNCTEPHCSLRHMELKKKRKEIPCYWEKQPGGCRKTHCAFKHQTKASQGESPNSPESSKKETEPTATQDWRNVKSEGASSMDSSAETPVADSSRRLSQGAPESYSSSPAAVEPIVVNFEEESDSESAPSWTPTKVPKEESLHVKTLEEIRLEKIQVESAAYWEGIAGGPMAWEAANPAVNPSANPSGSPCGPVPGPRKPCNSSTCFKKSNLHSKNEPKELDFRVLTLDEIRRKRAKKSDTVYSSLGGIDDPLNPQVLLNGHSKNHSRDFRSLLGITDLRTKLSNAKTLDGCDLPSLGDTWCSKRQWQDTSLQSGPTKKQRTRLCTKSDLAGENSLGTFSDDELLME